MAPGVWPVHVGASAVAGRPGETLSNYALLAEPQCERAAFAALPPPFASMSDDGR